MIECPLCDTVERFSGKPKLLVAAGFVSGYMTALSGGEGTKSVVEKMCAFHRPLAAQAISQVVDTVLARAESLTDDVPS